MQLDETQYQDKYRTIPWLDDNSISLSELIHFMVQNEIPLDARIQYEGCGSHQVEFWWKEPIKEEVVESHSNALVSSVDYEKALELL